MAGMSDCCLSGSVHSGTPKGTEATVAGLPCYVSEPGGGSKAKSVIFLTDIFGWKFPNVRLLADNYAKAGFYCYIPDLHSGDSVPLEALNHIEPPQSVADQLGMIEKGTNTAKTGAVLGPWLASHREAVTKPILYDFVNKVKTSAGTGKLGAIGFCWGGRYAVLLADGAAEATVDAAYACHPSLLAVPTDLEPVSKPLSFAFGDKDSLVPVSDVDKIRALFAAPEKAHVPTEIVVYPGQIHGFTLRSDWSNDAEKKAMDEAEKQGKAWFEKQLS